MKEELAIIAALLAIVGNVPYMIAIVKGHVRPHTYTWMVGAIVSCIIFFGQIVKGAGIGALPTAASEIFTIIIFLLSLKYRFTAVTRSDKLFFGLALLALVPWILTKDPTLSVVMAVCIDLVSFIPTLRKTWYHPHTEAPLLYVMNVARHILALFSLEAYNVATMLHSMAMIVVNGVMGAMIVSRAKKSRS